MSFPSAVQRLRDPEEVARAAASVFAQEVSRALAARGRFSVALAGGSTPRLLYGLLSGALLPWDRTEVFWGDERHVPPDHPQSNYRMAGEALLSKVPIPAANIHRIPGELADPEAAAREYEETLRQVFALDPGRLPRFDLILLGMGADGHTASLFPGSPALAELKRLVTTAWIPALGSSRITLTLPVLNQARAVVFLVCGEEKADALREVLEGERKPTLPAEAVQPVEGRLLWLVDEAAARRLKVS